MIDDKIAEISKRRGFISFWEAFDYMLLANYSELEAMMIGLELFNGQIWDKVINASCKQNNEIYIYSGSSVIWNIDGSSSTTVQWGTDVANSEPDDLLVEVFIMTREANPVYMPIYKSYIETRKYTEIPMLEKHIKSITLKLTTELSINLFKNGCNNKI